MRTRLISCFFVVVMLISSSTMAMADTIPGDYIGVITITGGDAVVHGGPFTIKFANGDTLFSFCLETSESLVSPSIAYITDRAIGGGTNAPSGGDPLDPKTAFLYLSYLANPQAFNTNALQVAIWTIEEEFSPNPNWVYDNLINIGYNFTLANNYIAMATAAGWTDTHGVQVVNAYYRDVTGALVNAQDMIFVPEPMTLLLLGLGLFGLGITRKKLKK